MYLRLGLVVTACICVATTGTAAAQNSSILLVPVMASSATPIAFKPFPDEQARKALAVATQRVQLQLAAHRNAEVQYAQAKQNYRQVAARIGNLTAQASAGVLGPSAQDNAQAELDNAQWKVDAAQFKLESANADVAAAQNAQTAARQDVEAVSQLNRVEQSLNAIGLSLRTSDSGTTIDVAPPASEVSASPEPSPSSATTTLSELGPSAPPILSPKAFVAANGDASKLAALSPDIARALADPIKLGSSAQSFTFGNLQRVGGSFYTAFNETTGASGADFNETLVLKGSLLSHAFQVSTLGIRLTQNVTPARETADIQLALPGSKPLVRQLSFAGEKSGTDADDGSPIMPSFAASGPGLNISFKLFSIGLITALNGTAGLHYEYDASPFGGAYIALEPRVSAQLTGSAKSGLLVLDASANAAVNVLNATIDDFAAAALVTKTDAAGNRKIVGLLQGSSASAALDALSGDLNLRLKVHCPVHFILHGCKNKTFRVEILRWDGFQGNEDVLPPSWNYYEIL